MEDLKTFTDEQVVVYVRTKDQESYLEIVLRYEDKLLRYARSLIGDEMQAADAVQNAFVKAFINLNSFDEKRKFSTWIYRIVHNEVMNAVIKYKKELPFLDDMDFESGENLEEIFIDKETKEKVQNCFTQLPLLYAEPLSLFFLEEKSYEEISDILRLPIGTVGTRIRRAKILMRRVCQTM